MADYQYRLTANEPEGVAFHAGRRQRVGADVDKKPQILMVGTHIEKTRGGISTLAAAILNSNLKDSFDIKYIASQAEDFGKIRKLTLAVFAAIQFIAACLLHKTDLVYVHVGSNASLYRESAFIVLGRIFGKQTITHFHAGDLNDYYSRRTAIGRHFIFFALGLSHRVIAVSHESARQLRHLNPALTVTVIPNTIDTSAFSNLVRGLQPPDYETVRLLFVGAIGKLKGERDLIKALALLKEDIADLKVSILGFGAENLQPIFEKHGVADMIEHLGAVPLDARIVFYERADIFVLPTFAEAMPISVIEAMAAGLPIVSTPVGGIPELIDDANEGFLVQCGDVKVLAKKIAFLANNRTARIAMGQKARMRALDQMDFAVYIDKLGRELSDLSGEIKKL